jgi:hypothetical protein
MLFNSVTHEKPYHNLNINNNDIIFMLDMASRHSIFPLPAGLRRGGGEKRKIMDNIVNTIFQLYLIINTSVARLSSVDVAKLWFVPWN